MRNRRVLRLVLTAAMVAVSVVLCRYFGFPTNGVYRIEIGFLPILAVAMMYGPVYGGVAYGLSDLVGAFVTTGVNPFITVCKVIFGAAMGAVFYKKPKIGAARCTLFFVICGITIDIVLMSPIFVYMFGYSWQSALSARAIGFAVNVPVRIALTLLVSRYLGSFLMKYGDGTAVDFMAYANSVQHTPRLGLDRMRDLCGMLGDPQNDLRFIHVAGTNGKGSICAFCEAILREAGYKVGKFTSPNLICVNERICVDGRDISDADFDDILNRIKPYAEKCRKKHGEYPSQFELWTAAALVYFKRKQCDYVVWEVGMGGEFDATNVISDSVLAVFAHIDLDHMAYLGDTVEKIAETKSRIIKKNSTVVSAVQYDTVAGILRREAENNGCRFIQTTRTELKSHDGIYEIFDYGDMTDIRLSLGGVYQPTNAAVAIEAAKCLGIDEVTIRKGLASAVHRARFEKIGCDPDVIYDGAHNPDGMRVFKASVDRYYRGARTVVFACMHDKDFIPSLKTLNDGNSTFIFTTVANNSRAMPADELCRIAGENGIAGTYANDLKSAIVAAKQNGLPVFVCGSLYLYKDLW